MVPSGILAGLSTSSGTTTTDVKETECTIWFEIYDSKVQKVSSRGEDCTTKESAFACSVIVKNFKGVDETKYFGTEDKHACSRSRLDRGFRWHYPSDEDAAVVRKALQAKNPA